MSKATLAQVAMASAGLTATGCADLLIRVGEAAPSAEEMTRCNAIIQPLMQMDLASARSLLTEAVKTEPDKKSGRYNVLKARASDARNIIGALKLVPGFKLDGLGWNKGADAARLALKEHGITNSGATVETPEEKAAHARDTIEAELFTKHKAELQSGEMTLAHLTELAAKQAVDAEVKKQADRIIEQKGKAYALLLAQTLIAVVEAMPEEAPAVVKALAVAVDNTTKPEAPKAKGKAKRGKLEDLKDMMQQ